MSNFEDNYRNLNPKQKEAVDTTEGPVMVIAGPGTGKTQILTLRIANILKKTDAAPDNILALTFTENAAANMRRRLVGLIGTEGYYVNISTFHGFANRLIQENPERFPAIIGGRNATDVDQISIIRSILEKEDLEILKPLGDKFFYVPKILSAIRHLKSEGIEPEKFRQLNSEKRKKIENSPDLRHEKGRFAGNIKSDYKKDLKNCDKNEELARIYEIYDEALRAERVYDFEDMLLEVIRALEKDKDFLLEIEERYQYVLVDEHQDTNGAQNRILELITSFFPNPNLFVVGDEKQAIYRFQGASIENFLYFKDKFPEARLISLEDNYRSTQKVLDSATSVIEKNSSNIRAPLRSSADRSLEAKKRNINIFQFDMARAEYRFISEKIKELIAKGVKAEEIAVLYRENRDAAPIAQHLELAGIPFALESDQNLLEDDDIRKLIRLLKGIDELGRDEVLAETLHIDFLDIPPLDVWKIIRARLENKDGVRKTRSLGEILTRPAFLWSLDLDESDRIKDLGQKLSLWKRQSKNEHFLRFFPQVVRESGYLAHILAHPGYFDKVSRLNAFYDEAKKAAGAKGGYRLSDFMEYLNILEEHQVKIRSKTGLLPNAVRLMTAHQSKGLEFDEVFITGATDGHWGNRRSFDSFDLPFRSSVEASELEKNEDERRLFYMAMTRARDGVWITNALKTEDGREKVPSQFLAEIKEELKEVHDGKELSELYREDGAKAFSKPTPSLPKIEDKEFLKELFQKYGLSATGLNNYLECPWKYVYRNLLRLPEAPTGYQMYGIAVHASLERFFKQRAAGEEAGKDYLLDRFEEELSRQPLPEDEHRSILGKGKKVLAGYYEEYFKNWNYRTISEFKADATIDPEIHITGKLDKLELLETPSDVVVVDYKVKKPISRNEIEGNTKTSNGDYKRQLVFYKLLLDSMSIKEGSETEPSKPRFHMREGVIDFVEPNERGIFKKESFVITEKETKELKAEVQRVAEEILELGFWNKSCLVEEGKNKDCEYCALRAMMHGRGAYG